MKIRLKPLDQQVVVVTGASSGIGLATAVAAAHQGAKVVLTARSRETLERTAAHLEAGGAQAVAVAADVSDRGQLERVAQIALERYGRIDTWINNAGISVYARLDQIDEADAQRIFQVNFWGVVHGSQVALPHLRSNGGALINVGSEVSEGVVPLQGIYSASKHAVKGYTDTLRLELEADEAPVSVTLIQPTAVDTPFPEHAGNCMSQAPKLPTPMIEPEKVASAILDAATAPARDVKVGAMAVINTSVAKILPSLADVIARMQIGRQQRNEPAQQGTGTLYQPGESGRVHGRGNQNAAKPSEARQANVRSA